MNKYVASEEKLLHLIRKKEDKASSPQSDQPKKSKPKDMLGLMNRVLMLVVLGCAVGLYLKFSHLQQVDEGGAELAVTREKKAVQKLFYNSR